MKPSQRQAWIENYLRETSQFSQASVDILDKDFVMEYISATGARWAPGLSGAPFCKVLDNDLREMTKAGVLNRHRSGLGDMAGMGFPRWVFVYSLADA
ncbi:hypothetical protein D3C81_935880 [compost metagenome]